MKKWHWMSAAGVAALGVATMAYAASISNLSGQSCGAFTGNWHFVNNQTGGGTGTLDVCFSSGCYSGVQPSKVNASNVHFKYQCQRDLAVGRHHTPWQVGVVGLQLHHHGTAEVRPKTDPNQCEPPK